MATDQTVYQFEGDTTAALGNFTWRSRKAMFPRQVKMCCGRVIFTEGDLADHQALVEARREAIKRNQAKIAAGLAGATGSIGGGYPIGTALLTATELETVPAAPSYSGDLSLQIKIYADGTLKKTVTIYESGVFKFDPGVRARSWHFELVGNVDLVEWAAIATTVRDLMRYADDEE